MQNYFNTLPKELRLELKKYTLSNDLRLDCLGSNYGHRYMHVYFQNRCLELRFHLKQLKTFLTFVQNNKNYVETMPHMLSFLAKDNTMDMFDSALVYSDKKIRFLRIADNRFRNAVSVVNDFTFDELETDELLNKLNKFINDNLR